MARRKKYNTFNKETGSLFYKLIFLCLFVLSLKLFGVNTFDEIVLLLLSVVSYFLVGFILRSLGIWRY